MSNLNIICKSDKTEFTNYFSEPLTFPVNAEISLVKASLTVPVITQQILTVPLIELADRTNIWMDVILDGIEETFTWRNLYDTWITIAGADQEAPAITEAQFYSGTYQFFLNNPIKIINPTPVPAEFMYKTSFQETFAKMINNRYDFYKVTPFIDWKRNETEIQNSFQIASWYNKVGNASAQVTPVQSLNWGINAIYNPRGISGRNPTVMNLLPANNTNWTIAANKLTSIGGGAANVYHNLHYSNNASIDPNGGYYQFNKNVGGTGLCSVGIKVTFGNTGTTRVPATLTDTTIIDVGLEFGKDANNTVRAIDGYKELTAGQYTSNYSPTHPIDEFIDNDEFFIMVVRDSVIGPNSNKFRVVILHGAPGTTVAGAQVIYESSVIGPANGQIDLDFIAMAEDVGHVLSDLQFIPVTNQSLNQGNFSDPLSGNGMQYQGNIFIRPGENFDEGWTDGSDQSDERFFNILGLNKFQQDNDFTEMRGSDQNNLLQLKWRRPLQVLAKDCVYNIGPSNISDVYQAGPNRAIITNSLNLTNLPRQLDVRINNIPLKNFSGSQPNASTLTGSHIAEGLNRIVGTIPTPQPNNVSNNIDWVIQYEPYTPVYRPLNNANAFTINQLNVEISYKDFINGTRKNIDNIDGTLALEFHVKPSQDKPEINNNLRPY